MRRQTYEIDKYDGLVGEIYFQEAISKFRPSVLSQMNESFKHSLQNSSLAYVGAIAENFFAPDDVIPSDAWNSDHEHFRKGIKWHEDLTETEAQIEAERYDRDKVHSEYMRNTDPWSMHNLGASFASAIWDPLSYVPMVGLGGKTINMSSTMLKRIGMVSNVSETINPLLAKAKAIGKPFKPVAVYGAEGALAETAFQIIKQASTIHDGEDIDWIGGLLDVTIASAFGGALGTIPTARNIKKALTPEQIRVQVGKSLDDLGQNGEVGTSPNGDRPLKDFEAEEKLQKELDQLDDNNAHLHDIDATPIVSYAKKVGSDVKVVLSDLLTKFRNCIT